MAEQEAERIGADKLHEGSDNQAAGSAANHIPMPFAVRSKVRCGDPKGHSSRPGQRDENAQANEDEQDRDRTGTRRKRLGSAGKAVNQPTDQAGQSSTDRPRAPKSEERSPIEGARG